MIALVYKKKRIPNTLGDLRNRDIYRCLSSGPKRFKEIQAWLANDPNAFSYKTKQGLVNRLHSLEQKGTVIQVPEKHSKKKGKWQLKTGVFGSSFDGYLLKTEVSYRLRENQVTFWETEQDIEKLNEKINEVQYLEWLGLGEIQVQDRRIIRSLVVRFGFLVLFLFLASFRRGIDTATKKPKIGWDQKKWLLNAFSFEDGIDSSVFSNQLLIELFRLKDLSHDEKIDKLDELEQELQIMFPNTYDQARKKEQEVDEFHDVILQDYITKRSMIDRLRE